ncbi:hypothetical protein ACFSHT_24110 [Paraburkholderia silviterrae]|uniref:hypothetical protein n=1 Tax=Paraburkholderia silviterrae TaxID=2528715 RepID=UPI0014053098|nr:hypothetical protein [Paraburkholderia silviterrae]
MRQASARPSKVHSNAAGHSAILRDVLTLLNTRTENYGAACQIGKRAADEFAACLRDDRRWVGFGLLGQISHHLTSTDCSHGVAVGFWTRVDELLVRASSPGIFTAFQQPLSAKGAHGPRANA